MAPRKKRKPREKIVARDEDLELISVELIEGRSLRDLDLGELQWLRKEAATMNAEALATKREDQARGGWHALSCSADWHAATLSFLRQVDTEIRREMSYRKKQFELPLI